MIDDEILLAYLDGELSPEETVRIGGEIERDATLADRLEAHRKLRDAIRGRFDALLDAPVPPHLLATASPDEKLIAFPNLRRFLPQREQWAAIAATLMIGIVGGSMLAGGPRDGAPLDTRLSAPSELASLLDHDLASAPSGQGALKVGVSFRDRSGSYCRSFEGQGAQGLACHRGGGWRIEGMFPAQAPASGSYRQAASSPVMAMIEPMIDGELLDADQEKAARDRHWK